MWGKFEPVLNAQTISAVISAAITLAVAFGAPITEDQRNALLLFGASLISIAFGGAIAGRAAVTPVERAVGVVNAMNAPITAKENAIRKISTGEGTP